MIQYLFILIGFISFSICQNINLTQQSYVHGGTAYLVSEEDNPSVKFHAITFGQHFTGSASSSSYNMDFGIWAFYLKWIKRPSWNMVIVL